MTESSTNKGTLGGDPLTSEVYRIYRQELAQHFERLTRIAEEGLLSSDCVLEIRTRFHTIKGGAGFFGFNELVEVAGQIENRAAKSQVTLNELEQALTSMSHIIDQLPSL